MSESTVNYSRSASFSLPADTVWDVLLRFEDNRLYTWNAQTLVMTGERSFSGTAVLRGTPFRVEAAPYDLKLSSARSRAGIRIKSTSSGCTAIAACAVPRASAAAGRQMLDDFLMRLRNELEAPVPDDTSVLDTDGTSSFPAPASRIASKDDAETQQGGTGTEKPAKERKAGKTPGRKRSPTVPVLIVFLLILLTAAGAFFTAAGFMEDRDASLVPVVSERGEGSEKVTLETALQIQPGDSRSSVDSRLGKHQEGTEERSVYLSSERTPYGTPAVAVQVIYDGGTASQITVLDLLHASSVGEITADSLSSASSLSELEEQAGSPVSMVRSYTENGIPVREYHFGYIDPHHNFSPSWQGQLWAKVGEDGSFVSGTGYAYDGSDPLFHSRLPESPDRQYDDFDAYLDDFLGYHFCLGFRDQPYRWDALSMIPGLSFVSQLDETSLYNGYSGWSTADREPVWAYTAGFGIRGDFVLFSAVNRRIWKNSNQLGSSDCSAVRSGMSFSEAEGCMGILPTMIYIDHSFITLGYGEMNEETDVLTEQFEFCIRFTLNDGTVESIYDNTGTQIIID